MSMLSKQNKKILITRTKSFLWRSAMVVIVVALDFVSKNLGLFDLSPETIVIVGLVLGEVSKELNNKYDLEKYLRPTTN